MPINKNQVILFGFYWVMLLVTFFFDFFSTGGGCGNCAVMSARQYWYLFALPPALFHIPKALSFTIREKRLVPFVITLPLIAIIIFSFLSFLILGNFYIHGSIFDVTNSFLGRIWWFIFLVSGLSMRPLFLGRIQLKKWWAISFRIFHILAILILAYSVFAWISLDFVLWDDILKYTR